MIGNCPIFSMFLVLRCLDIDVDGPQRDVAEALITSLTVELDAFSADPSFALVSSLLSKVKAALTHTHRPGRRRGLSTPTAAKWPPLTTRRPCNSHRSTIIKLLVYV